MRKQQTRRRWQETEQHNQWFNRMKTDILDIMETNFRTLSSTYTGMNGYVLCNQYFVLKIKIIGEK